MHLLGREWQPRDGHGAWEPERREGKGWLPGAMLCVWPVGAFPEVLPIQEGKGLGAQQGGDLQNQKGGYK